MTGWCDVWLLGSNIHYKWTSDSCLTQQACAAHLTRHWSVDILSQCGQSAVGAAPQARIHLPRDTDQSGLS